MELHFYVHPRDGDDVAGLATKAAPLRTCARLSAVWRELAPRWSSMGGPNGRVVIVVHMLEFLRKGDPPFAWPELPGAVVRFAGLQPYLPSVPPPTGAAIWSDALYLRNAPSTGD